MKRLACMALILAGATPAAWGGDTVVSAILTAHHAAVGSPPPHGAVMLRYRYVGSGLVGTQTTHVDLESGAFTDRTEASGISEANGFDGTVPWQQDISGTATPQQGGDRIPMAVDEAYRRANLWWRADRGGAAITYVDQDEEGARTLQHLAVTPRGGRRFDAWFDRKSHELMRVSYDQQFLHVTERYSDYRREGPMALPHTIEIDVGLGPQGITRLTLLEARFGPAAPLSAYSLPAAPLKGALIAGGAPSATVPFRLLNNHIYVEASVDGHGPYTFILDTGGHTNLSPRLIREVGLKSVGAAVTSGAGEKHETTGFVRFHEIAIGALQLHDQVGFATDVYDKAIEGISVDGMVGFELLRRMVTTIDYGRRTLTFTQPAPFTAGPETGVSVPFVFYDHVPFVAGRIDDLPAHFDIDTGSRSDLDITTPFVEAHHLRDRFPRGVTAVTGVGVGGPVRSYVVRLPSLTLGPVTVGRCIADLSQMHAGSFSDPNYDGNVGGALLKRFRVTFDYTRQIMYLKPIEPVPADSCSFDRSGLWIDAHGDGYTVMDVAANSAAAVAGLAVGDLVTSVDGRTVKDEALSDMRQRLRTDPPGTRVKLTVRRGVRSFEITLVLSDQV